MTADVAEREGLHKLNLSGTKFRQMLRAGAGCGDAGVRGAGCGVRGGWVVFGLVTPRECERVKGSGWY